MSASTETTKFSYLQIIQLCISEKENYFLMFIFDRTVVFILYNNNCYLFTTTIETNLVQHTTV